MLWYALLGARARPPGPAPAPSRRVPQRTCGVKQGKPVGKEGKPGGQGGPMQRQSATQYSPGSSNAPLHKAGPPFPQGLGKQGREGRAPSLPAEWQAIQSVCQALRAKSVPRVPLINATKNETAVRDQILQPLSPVSHLYCETILIQEQQLQA